MEESPWETANWSWLAGVMSASGSFTLAKTAQPKKWGKTHFVKYVLRSSKNTEMVQTFARMLDKMARETSLGYQVTLNADELHKIMTRLWDAGLTDEVKRKYKKLKLESNSTRFE